MQRWFFLSILALLCLVPVADLSRAQQPANADKKEEALKKLEALTKELNALEEQMTEERIVARTSVLDREEAVRSLERQHRGKEQVIAAERTKLEEVLKEIESKATPDAATKIKEEVRKKLDFLVAEGDKLAAQAAQARKDQMIAEEKFKLMERRHDNYRHLANLKLELVEHELFGKSDATERRKLDKLEKGMETIQRDLDELRRKLGVKDAP